MLAYNCSPSFNWRRHLDDDEIARFQKELGAMGYKFQFITLAGRLNSSMFELATGYSGRDAGLCPAPGTGVLLEPAGYTATRHQGEVGAGCFDQVATVIATGKASTLALAGSTEKNSSGRGRLRTGEARMSNIVHVVGTGTIREPLIGLLADDRAAFGIDEVTFHKRTPLITERGKVNDLVRRGAALVVDDHKRATFEELGHAPKWESREAIERAKVVIDCTPVGNENKAEFYEAASGPMGFMAQGLSSDSARCTPGGQRRGTGARRDRFLQIVSCNTHNIAVLVKTLAMEEDGTNHLVDGRFLCIRRSNDISQDTGFAPKPIGGASQEPAVRHAPRPGRPRALRHHWPRPRPLFERAEAQHPVHARHPLQPDPRSGGDPRRGQGAVVRQQAGGGHLQAVGQCGVLLGRDHGYFGRILSQTVVALETLAVRNGNELVGFCFTPRTATRCSPRWPPCSGTSTPTRSTTGWTCSAPTSSRRFDPVAGPGESGTSVRHRSSKLRYQGEKDGHVEGKALIPMVALVALAAAAALHRPRRPGAGQRRGDRPQAGDHRHRHRLVARHPRCDGGQPWGCRSSLTASVKPLEASQLATDVIAAVRDQGVAQEDIQTTDYSIYPEYDYSGQRERIVGYRVTNMLQVTVRDIDQSGAVIDAATAAGGDASQVGGVSLVIEDDAGHDPTSPRERLGGCHGQGGAAGGARGSDAWRTALDHRDHRLRPPPSRTPKRPPPRTLPAPHRTGPPERRGDGERRLLDRGLTPARELPSVRRVK